ncbi:hypothetical protein IE53DRAFT_386570 [Violaceomyces palustris]|uniref:Uncharacterized protein n=1 Tax=Violaceomyces palustris TaxID=1673888 RepID=A0ACD0NZ31_9BASI|nr:hypothetical protein IE53DRAFT_386570 [Violaceomyces palustris]
MGWREGSFSFLSPFLVEGVTWQEDGWFAGTFCRIMQHFLPGHAGPRQINTFASPLPLAIYANAGTGCDHVTI